LVNWNKSTAGDTSRAVFSSFVEALKSEQDPASGGCPQLVSLYREGAGRMNGIVYRRAKYFAGIPIIGNEAPKAVDWFNESFERCDPVTLERLEGAQIHEKGSA
jgi:hypothetical protein